MNNTVKEGSGNDCLENIKDITTDDVLIYTNPTNQNITVKTYFNQETNVYAELRDIFGKLISNINNEICSGNYEKVFDMSGLQNGIYFISIIAGEKKIIKKVIKY